MQDSWQYKKQYYNQNEDASIVIWKSLWKMEINVFYLKDSCKQV